LPLELTFLGTCYKGSKCDFLHPGSGQSNERPNPETELENIAHIINLQLGGTETPEYPYSSFSPHVKSQNNLIANRDYSPEEYRWDYMQAMRSNTLPQFQSRMAERDADRKRIVDYILSDRRKAARFSQLTIERRADKAYEPPAASSGGFGASSGGALGSNRNSSGSAFGQHGFGSNSNTPSAFGSSSGGSGFGGFANKSSTGSAFGAASNNTSSTTASPFGSGQSAFGGKPAFGQSAFGSGGSTGSAFGSGTSSSTSAFGQSSFGAGASSNTGSTSAFGQSGFGAGANTAASPFGQASSTAKPAGSAFGQSTFGQSSFGQSAFGSTNSNDKAGAGSAFGQSAFGSANNNDKAGTGSAFGQSAFGASTAAPAFGQSGFGGTPSNTNTTAAGTTDSAATGSITKSPFGTFGSSSNTSAFGQSAFGQSSFGQAASNTTNSSSANTGSTTGGSAFGAFGNQAPTDNAGATSSPFGKATAGTSPFGQTSAFGSSAFGQANNTTKPASSGGFGAFSGNAGFGSTAPAISAAVPVRRLNQGGPGETLPKLADLHELVREAFEATEFELGKIPDTVPPLEVR